MEQTIHKTEMLQEFLLEQNKEVCDFIVDVMRHHSDAAALTLTDEEREARRFVSEIHPRLDTRTGKVYCIELDDYMFMESDTESACALATRFIKSSPDDKHWDMYKMPGRKK